MTWDMFAGGVGSGVTAVVIAGLFCGFSKYVCIFGCVWVVACAAFGIAGMVTGAIHP